MGISNNQYRTPCNVYPRRLMVIYYGMKQRCYYKKQPYYSCYGGRGIKICDEWLGDNGAATFYKWAMANGYNENSSIDRIDNDKGYSPDNCRFIPRLAQQANRRCVDKIMHHIEQLPSGRFRVTVTKNGDRMRELFDNLDDAKIFRDLLYKETFYGATR